MIELGPGADVFRLVGGFFWLLMFGALLAALLIPKHWVGKLVAVSIVIGLFVAFPGRWAWERKKESDAYHTQLAKAEAIFNERCKAAGEKIYKTVDNVDGLLLMKVRKPFEAHAQNAEDPFGSNGNVSGDGYIASFLAGYKTNGNIAVGFLDSPNDAVKPGYSYVEADDPQDGKRYRYSGSIRVAGKKDTTAPGIQRDMAGNPDYDLNLYRFVVDKVPAPGPAPRYGVTFEDITTPDERALWIAGSSFRVIDLQTQEILAVRIGYFMDKGLGSRATFREPWNHAVRWSCPDYYVNGQQRTNWDRKLTEQVLKIKGE